MTAQYELLKELLNSGTTLSFGQDIFFKFYQAFILKDRWLQYINGVGTTLLVTAIALALGVGNGGRKKMIHREYSFGYDVVSLSIHARDPKGERKFAEI